MNPLYGEFGLQTPMFIHQRGFCVDGSSSYVRRQGLIGNFLLQ